MIRHAKLSDEDAEELRRAWEYHQLCDNLAAARMNYGMIAQSMLVVSYTTLFVASSHTRWVTSLEILIAAFGCLYGIRQFAMVDEQLQKMFHLKEYYLEPIDPIFKEMQAVYPLKRRSLQRGVPVAMVALWAFLIVIAVGRTGLSTWLSN